MSNPGNHASVHRSGAWLVAILALPLAAVAADPPNKESLDQFRRTVAPALSAKCVPCHRPENLKGRLDLTSFAAATRGGRSGPALRPGEPDDSPLFFRSVPEDGKPPEMPQKGEALSADELKALRLWIEKGAAWPADEVLREKAKADATFWSFKPIRRVEPPVGPPGDAWSAHPIDRFVGARLREKGLAHNPPASPRVFIRRASYDLTGLPPSPASIDAFLNECAAETGSRDRLGSRSVGRLIDRLLADPAYGEHWGRHWLDVIRFGESRGYERNEIILNLWPFRDYVIKSVNDDKPFDRLILEHLAGDVIGKDRPEVEIGSAFLVAGPYDDVGNQDPAAAAQIRSDQMDEMIRATGESFLGLTVGCARCHDHKFDPILTRDYYAMFATFAGTVHGPREVSSKEQREARAKLLAPLEARRKTLVDDRDKLAGEIRKRAEKVEVELTKKWTRPRADRYGTEEKFPAVEAKYVRLTVEGTDADPGRGPYKLDEFEVWTAEKTPRNVALASNGGTAAGAATEAKDFAGAYSAALAIDGKFDARWIARGPELTVTFAKPEKIDRVLFSSDRTKSLPADSFLTVFVGDYRVETSMDGKTWTKVADSSDRAPSSKARRDARIAAATPKSDDTARSESLGREIAKVDAEIAKIPPLPVWWVGTHPKADGPHHVYIGGSPQRKGDQVVASSPAVLDGLSSRYMLKPDTPESDRRLALARWIVADDNPLTSRVLANRVWHYHFGTGIVDTPSDFGYMGSRPTHPELLDWLSTELTRGGWSLKHLHRVIMTSQVYAQSSTSDAERLRIDGDSRLLWRFPPRRLGGEEIRDTLLTLSDKLDRRMGGPGFRLYEYQQDNVATYVPLDRPGPESYRRAVYHHNARSARVDVLTDFDCPDPAFADPRRAVTTTALQALTMMNHQFSADMAIAFAERMKRDSASPEDQARAAFRLAFCREIGPDELNRSAELIKKHGIVAFCRAIINSNELISID